MKIKAGNIIERLNERKYNAANGASKLFKDKIHKAYLRKKEIFGWLFEGRDTIDIELSKEQIRKIVDSHKDTVLIKHLLLDIGDSNKHDISNNSFMIKKNLYKISRYIPKYIKELNKKVDIQYFDLFKELEKQHIEFMENQTYESFNKIQNIKAKLDTLPCYIPQLNLQQYYSDIKTGSGILTLLPEDLITCSTNSSFSSCLREYGEYHEGVYQYALDECSFMAVIRQNDKNIGRQFIFVDGLNISFGKVYGQIDSQTKENIRSLVCTKLAKFHKIPNTWEHVYENLSSCNIVGAGGSVSAGRFGYVDGAQIMKSRHKSEGKDWDLVRFNFPVPIYFNGKQMKSRAKQCTECGKVIDGDSTVVEGRRVCIDCYTKLAGACSNCSNRYFKQNMKTIGPHKLKLCEKCFTNKYIECEKCKSPVLRGETIRIGVKNVCSKCAKIKEAPKKPSITTGHTYSEQDILNW